MDADNDLHGAEAEFRRALALAPNDGNINVTYGIIPQVFGELAKALELTQQAIATDPLRADWLRHLAMILFSLNRPDEAERTMQRVLATTLTRPSPGSNGVGATTIGRSSDSSPTPSFCATRVIPGLSPSAARPDCRCRERLVRESPPERVVSGHLLSRGSAPPGAARWSECLTLPYPQREPGRPKLGALCPRLPSLRLRTR
jgi:hypothetical protein